MEIRMNVKEIIDDSGLYIVMGEVGLLATVTSNEVQRVNADGTGRITSIITEKRCYEVGKEPYLIGANIYYAHPISLYNTPIEERDLKLLGQIGSVLNPNQPQHAEKYKTCGMEYFRGLVAKCDMVAFRTFPDGKIPAGVAKEIEWAKKEFKPVFELPTPIGERTLTVQQTKERLLHNGER